MTARRSDLVFSVISFISFKTLLQISLIFYVIFRAESQNRVMLAARALTCSSLRALTRGGARKQILPQLSFATSSARPSSGDHVKMWTAERAVSLAQV